MSEVTLAVFVTVPAAAAGLTVATIGTTTLAPLARDAVVQVTSLPLTVHVVPAGGVTETNPTPGGRVSVITVLAAAVGPLFRAVRV